MTTMQRFKAYFGMVPPADYEDDYLDDGPDRSDGYRGEWDREWAGSDRGYGVEYLDDRPEFDRPGYDRVPDYAYAGPVRASGERVAAIDRSGQLGSRDWLEPLGSRSAGGRAAGMRTSGARMTRGALAMDRVFEDGNPLAKITTLRPRDYSEARTIGERFRDGNPVIMDLVEMSNDDAKRLVDFAAGLAFALHGAFDKVATKVFLLSPADIDVSAEDRRRIVETGFYNQS